MAVLTSRRLNSPLAIRSTSSAFGSFITNSTHVILCFISYHDYAILGMDHRLFVSFPNKIPIPFECDRHKTCSSNTLVNQPANERCLFVHFWHWQPFAFL